MIQNMTAMQNTDVRTVDPTILVDISGVIVNTSLPREDRLLDYITQVKNPYCFKHGKTVVKVSFTDTEATLEDRLERYLLSI